MTLKKHIKDQKECKYKDEVLIEFQKLDNPLIISCMNVFASEILIK